MSAQSFDNLQNMRCKKDGDAAHRHTLQHGLESSSSHCIHAFKRFIEKENFRTVDDGGWTGGNISWKHEKDHDVLMATAGFSQ